LYFKLKIIQIKDNLTMALAAFIIFNICTRIENKNRNNLHPKLHSVISSHGVFNFFYVLKKLVIKPDFL
jgi:hypothetical protein